MLVKKCANCEEFFRFVSGQPLGDCLSIEAHNSEPVEDTHTCPHWKPREKEQEKTPEQERREKLEELKRPVLEALAERDRRLGRV